PHVVRGQTNVFFDLLIKNGRIVDGCGTPWYTADLGVKSGRIVRIGRLVNARAQRTLDAKGLVVAPGFINMMGQTAGALLQNPQAANNLLAQGITTMLTGKGVSEAPLSPGQAKTNGWKTMREFLVVLEHRGLPLNIAQTVGHTQIRRLVLGDTDRAPTSGE